MSTGGMVPRRTRVGALALALATLLAGCAVPLVASPPGPGVPRISRLELGAERAQAGCPVMVRFQFDDEEADASGKAEGTRRADEVNHG